MSKLKTPQQKKRASLARDRRNTFGESPHAARKSIPGNKARQHQSERRAADQTLAQALGGSGTDALDSIENQTRARARLKRISGFRKYPDAPLGEVIAHKQARRIRAAGRKKRSRARQQTGIVPGA